MSAECSVCEADLAYDGSCVECELRADVDALTAERDALLEELAGCHCGRSMVHKSCVAQRGALRTALEQMRCQLHREGLPPERQCPPPISEDGRWACQSAREALGGKS